MIIELEQRRQPKNFAKFPSTSGKSAAENFLFRKFLLAQKMRLEIAGGPLAQRLWGSNLEFKVI